MFIAHKTEDGKTQSIKEHNEGVAALCAEFASSFGAEELGRQLGLAHDIGKYSDAFQKRISGADIRVDHSTAGAQEIARYLGMPAAYCVAGHHGGLPDGGGRLDDPSSPTLGGRLKRAVEPYQKFSEEIKLSRVGFKPPKILGRGGFTMAFWIRMLFSCLVDADYLDTENFMRGSVPRGSVISMKELLSRHEEHIAPWWNAKSDLNRIRCDILRACGDAGSTLSPGLFTLTVPTGGGKTISSLEFALRHAVANQKKRVIYVIPYTGIIEQTADKFRSALGEDAVLEHHSNVDFDDGENILPDSEKSRKKLAAENWDLPVVVTTAVRFFESLFSNRPSGCRKLHNIAESVIIFDEAQTLPLPYLLPCVRAIAELAVNYGTSCVLCTATQPALGQLFSDIAPELCLREIAPPVDARVFQRVRYKKLDPLPDEQLAEKLSAERQVLCITSTRKQAQKIFDLLQKEGSFHLSTLMTPEHRRATLKIIKDRLKDGLDCRVVSTSLIEAGVDVDFPTVYREEAGLDSIVQSAGRCNREGLRPTEQSFVYIFGFKEGATLPNELRRPLEVMRIILRENLDPDDPEAIERYFTALRRFTGEGIDRLSLVEKFENGVQNPSQPSFPFAETSEKFHLIEQNARAVLIPRSPDGEFIAKRLQTGGCDRALLRRATKHSVNVYESHFKALYAHGALQITDAGPAILTDLSLYREETGLSLFSSGGEGIFL